MLICIIKDLAEPIHYLPWGILAGGVCYVCFRSKPAAAFAAYMTIMIIFAFFSREPGSRLRLDLIPFSTWGITPQSRAYVIENVLMFIPFGILGPLIFPLLKKGKWCVAAGIAVSTALELAQLFTGRGYCQTDDIIMNGLGTWIGHGIIMFYKKIYR